MRFGRFDDDAREYVIERPDTPLPWINYLGNDGFFGLVSNTGGGYCFARDARLRRLVRARYNAAPHDLGGRHLYLRDDATGDAWSPTWRPMPTELDAYECRHGLATTTITSGRRGIGFEARAFVPLGEDGEVWTVRLRNHRAEPARLSLFVAVEWCLWDAWDDATNFQRNWSTGEVQVERDGALLLHTTEYRERRDHVAYLASSVPPAAFDTSRDAFCGPHRGWDRPLAVERGACSGSVAHGWAPCAAQQVTVELAPWATTEATFVLGYWENPRDAKFDPPGSTTVATAALRDHLDAMLAPGRPDAARDELDAHWSALLGTFQVSTPDPHVDRMVNTWNPYQCMVTFNLSRSASSFESGIGRGMGFRDSNQDLLGFVHLVPERARERLLDIAATQRADGSAYHQYQPLTKRGNDAIGSGFNDDPLWLVLATAAYLKETGDLTVLAEPVPFDNEPGTDVPLLEHLRRSVQHTLDRLGPHGLPLIGRADWNDCLNLNCFSETPGEPFQTTENREGGVAESVFIAGLFVLAARELAGILDVAGRTDEAGLHRRHAERMAASVDEHGWDGAWFRRAYDHAGRPVGSAACDEGRIYVEPQGICVLAGIGLDDGRAASAIDATVEHLGTPHGLVLLQPAYTRYRLELGEISTYPPGYKENAGVFCHTNPWIVIAAAMLGDGDRAMDLYRRTNPSAREAISEVHRCEPYVYAQMIAGRDAPTHGEAKNSWLTGTAAWSLVAATQWILGIRPEHDGLRVDPVLPAAWGGFTATRRFRGSTYRIRVDKEPGSSGRVRTLLVDGATVNGTLVAPARAGTEVAVVARVERD